MCKCPSPVFLIITLHFVTQAYSWCDGADVESLQELDLKISFSTSLLYAVMISSSGSK